MVPKSEVLDELFSVRDVLSDTIIGLTPTSPSEKQAMLSLVQRRDRISATINNIIAAAFNDAATGLEQKIEDLEKQTQALQSLAQTLANVLTAVQITDAVIGLAISIAALAAVP